MPVAHPVFQQEAARITAGGDAAVLQRQHLQGVTLSIRILNANKPGLATRPRPPATQIAAKVHQQRRCRQGAQQTEYRINLTLYNLARVIAGDELDDVINPLIAEDQAARLSALEDEFG